MRATAERSLLPFPEGKAGEADGEAELQCALGVVDRPGERMQQRGWSALFVKGAQQVVLCVTLAGLRSAVQDRRLVQLFREAQVAAQVGQLVVARREATVVVEARLADGNHHRVAREIRDCRKVAVAVARDVRVDAHAGVEREFGTDN